MKKAMTMRRQSGVLFERKGYNNVVHVLKNGETRPCWLDFLPWVADFMSSRANVAHVGQITSRSYRSYRSYHKDHTDHVL